MTTGSQRLGTDAGPRATAAARRSRWSRAHAARLFWRAGFGATPAELDWWARRSREEAVHWLVHGGRGPHGRRTMVGRAPSVDGHPLDPLNEWGHDQLWWLDRMVRSQRPLVERMTLFWHDHFATTGQETPLMLAQNRFMRGAALRSFRFLLGGITKDPAMQQFLSLVDSDKRQPNENFARELMELFTLGAGAGYTEHDVREAARALTGFRGVWRDGQPLRVRYDAEAHDDGVKHLFGHRGRLDWTDVLDLVVAHRDHAPFLVGKLWDHFAGVSAPRSTRRRLERLYVHSGHRIAPVVEEILVHPAIYRDLDAPWMVKWPAVYYAGMLRTVGRPVDKANFTWQSGAMGQQLFDPPSVAGWDTGPAWMSTSTMRARFLATTYVCADPPVAVGKNEAKGTWSAREQVRRARAATGDPWTSGHTDRELLRLANEFLAQGRAQGRGEVPDYIAALAQSALRHLLSGPDNHLC